MSDNNIRKGLEQDARRVKEHVPEQVTDEEVTAPTQRTAHDR